VSSILHPHQTPDGKTTTVWLDWGDSSHYGGPVRSCESCGQGTRTLNGAGDPQHKACAEYELGRSRGDPQSQRGAEQEPQAEAS
jgi:hypothetical protein